MLQTLRHSAASAEFRLPLKCQFFSLDPFLLLLSLACLLVQVNLDLITLALYDIVIWADDSTSMQALDHGERIQDLKAILGRVADAATLFDTDGKTFGLQVDFWGVRIHELKLSAENTAWNNLII